MTNTEAIGVLAIVVETSKGKCRITDDFISEAYKLAINALKAQEDAQEVSNDPPEVDNNFGELISKHAAIDAFLTELTKRERKNLLHTWSTVEVKYFVVEMLEQLPSAQPEIIRCKDCKYYHDSDGCFFSTAETEENGFCSWAERRTDG